MGKESTTGVGTFLSLPTRLNAVTRSQLPTAARDLRACDVRYLLQEYAASKRAEAEAKANAERIRDALLPVVRQSYATSWAATGARPKRPVAIRLDAESQVCFVVTEPREVVISDDAAEEIARAGFGDHVTRFHHVDVNAAALRSAEVLTQLRSLVDEGKLPKNTIVSRFLHAFRHSAEATLNASAAEGAPALQRFLHAASAVVRQHFTV